MRKKVREIHKYGADLIKICATGGVLSKGDSGRRAADGPIEEMKVAVDEAHMLGLKVAVHAHGTSGINDAIRAGVDTIEHASLADAERYRVSPRQKGTVFDMDIYNDDFILSRRRQDGHPCRRAWRRSESIGSAAARNLQEARSRPA